MLIPSIDFPRPANTDGTDTIRPAALRGLGPDQTLVLLNGKRYHTSALVNLNGSVGKSDAAVDLNSIPAFALNGAEILRDGAAAQYGSDAIAGVINLRASARDLNFGASLSTTLGQTYHDDGAGTSGIQPPPTGVALNRQGTGFTQSDGRLLKDRGYTDRTDLATRPAPAVLRCPPRPRRPFGGSPRAAANGDQISRERDGHCREATASTTTTATTSAIPSPTIVWWLREPRLWASFDNGIDVYAFGGYNDRHKLFHHAPMAPAGRLDTNVRRRDLSERLPAGASISIVFDGLRPPVGSDGTARRHQAVDLSQTYGRNNLWYYTVNSLNASYGAGSPTRFYDGEMSFQQETTNARSDAFLEHPCALCPWSKSARLAANSAVTSLRHHAGRSQHLGQRRSQRILDGPSDIGKATRQFGAQGFGGF